MNMCGLHTETLFNTKFLDIPEFCVNTHLLSLKNNNHSIINNVATHTCAWFRGLLLFLGRGSPRAACFLT